jgi:TPR repeat protein
LPDSSTSPRDAADVLGNATPLAAVPAAPLTMPPRSLLPPTPLEAFRSGTQALRQGKTDQAVIELEYAAEQGVPGAIWKLGRMYADGDGVKMNKARAYDYFRRLTTMHADDGSSAPNARFLANAFVTLGLYHLDGIPGTLKADPNVAREMFRYAASYFADPEAQYYLGRLFLLGKGAPKDLGALAGCRTRAIIVRRRCSAACCSTASRFRARLRSGCSGSSSPRTRRGRTRAGSPTCTAARSLRPAKVSEH